MLESLFNNVAGSKDSNVIKKRLQLRRFPVKFAEFLITLFLQNTSGSCFCTYSFKSSLKSKTMALDESKYYPLFSDINECLESKDLCEQSCVNTPGSYYCQCHEGYKHDGVSCKGR